MGQEVGDKKGHLHNQCSYGTWVQGNGQSAKDAIVKAIKETLHIQPGDKANVVVKLANLNDKKYLTGYTQKQAGKDTYRFHSKGLSVDYLAESKVFYDATSTQFGKNKLSISRSNMIQIAFSFYQSQLGNLQPVPTLVSTLKWMMKSWNYYFSATFLTGYPLDLDRAE